MDFSSELRNHTTLNVKSIHCTWYAISMLSTHICVMFSYLILYSFYVDRLDMNRVSLKRNGFSKYFVPSYRNINQENKITCRTAGFRNLCEVILAYIINKRECMQTHQNNNVTHYLCWSTFIQKYGLSSSRVYCVFAKKTNANF